MDENVRFLFIRYSEALAKIVPEVSKIFEENNYDKKYMPACIDWCINESLLNSLLLNVINNASCDMFKIVYSKIAFLIDTQTRAVVSMDDTSIFSDRPVKTLCNGKDLIISTYYNVTSDKI